MTHCSGISSFGFDDVTVDIGADGTTAWDIEQEGPVQLRWELEVAGRLYIVCRCWISCCLIHLIIFLFFETPEATTCASESNRIVLTTNSLSSTCTVVSKY